MDAKPQNKLSKLQINLEVVNLRDIEESQINAQEMSDTDFKRLVANIKEDGGLTSAILIMEQSGKSKYLCISGHHRIKASIKAGIDTAPAIIIPEIEESKRVRLQLVHNDLHGSPNPEIVSVMQRMMTEIDLKLIDFVSLDKTVEEAKSISYDIPVFTYVNICLLEESRDSLVNVIMAMENNESEKWLIEKEEYDHMKDLLSMAFRNGFRTPGQAFRKFLDIVEENKDQIKRQ